MQLFVAIRVGQNETLGRNLAFCVLVKCKAGSHLCDEDQLLINIWHTWGTELNGVAMPLLVHACLVIFVGFIFYFFLSFKLT